MRCAVCYHPDQAIKTAERGHSPSALKPALLVAQLQASDWPLDWLEVRPLEPAEIALAHDKRWVSQVLSRRAPNGFGTRSAQVAATLPWTTGSMAAAALAATPERPALSPTSGFHHAAWSKPEGFCTFNGLVIAARLAIAAGKSVAILDCDAHYGDGTDAILAHLGLEEAIPHWSIGATCEATVLEWDQTAADAFALNNHLAERVVKLLSRVGDWLAEHRPDVLLYQAGADPHIDDPYGGILTTHDLLERDRTVFRAARELGVAVAWNLAGGYQRDAEGTIQPVLDLHLNTMRAALGH